MHGLPLMMAAVAGVSAMDGTGGDSLPSEPFRNSNGPLLHYSFPSEADTLAYVDALKHSDLSQWRSLEEVSFYYRLVQSPKK